MGAEAFFHGCEAKSRNSRRLMALAGSGELVESSKAVAVCPPDSVATEQICTVERLQTLLKDYRLARYNAQASSAVYPTGLALLDEALPAGGLQPATVVDCLCPSPGTGATRLVLHMALAVSRDPTGVGHRQIVFIDSDNQFYPPAAADAGVDLSRLLIVKPADHKQAFWAAEQCLLCSAIGAVVAVFANLETVHSRRLQLAAEACGGVGFILRSRQSKIKSARSFAAVQLLVEPFVAGKQLVLPEVAKQGETGKRLVNITVIRVREGMPAGPFVLEIPDEAGFMPTFEPTANRKDNPAAERTAAG